jgi:hypothetical protein
MLQCYQRARRLFALSAAAEAARPGFDHRRELELTLPAILFIALSLYLCSTLFSYSSRARSEPNVG